jgi:hypothetical protein
MKCLKPTLVLLALLGSQAYASTTCSTEDSKAIKASILEYVGKQTAVSPDNITILSEKCVSPYASATVHLIKPVTDDATIYLHNVDNHWKVLSMGTDFDEEFLATIPQELRK